MPRELTKKEKEIIKLAQKGGKDKDLVILQSVHEITDKFDDLEESFKIIKRDIANNLKNDSVLKEKILNDFNESAVVKLALKLSKFKKGDKGDNPTKLELMKLIRPLIPARVTDDELLALITPLIPEPIKGQDADEEKIIKRVTSEIESKIPTVEDVTNNLPILGEKVRDSLEVLTDDERLDHTAIKGLEEQIKELEEKISKIPKGRTGGARKTTYIKRENLSSQCNGATKTFTLPADTIEVIGVWGTQFPVNFNPGTDWTFAGRTLTLTAEVSAPATGQTLYCLIETLFYG